jgi:hypothetical protein
MVVLFLHNGGIYAFFWHRELIKGTSAKAALERGTKNQTVFEKIERFFSSVLHYFSLHRILYNALLRIFEFCFDQKS